MKHGGKGKRGWRKLHLGVDGSGVIVAQALTDGNADDAKTGLDLIECVEGKVASFTADAAYDTVAIYEAASDGLFGEAHLRRAIEQYLEHFHIERNHQGLGNELIDGEVSTVGEVTSRERLGGLLRYYYLAA